jgi:plasmid maintenance system antidote protein VapI
MTEPAFQPNWASPPGETILSILRARDIPVYRFSELVGLAEHEALRLLSGKYPIDSDLAKRISAKLGSTPRFWTERERRYQSSLKTLALRRPELEQWFRSFPIAKMREMGWISKFANHTEAPFELLDFFAVSTVAQWKDEHVSRLERIKFRTSSTFENGTTATTAWLRRGELVAQEVSSKNWNPEGFRKCLRGLKSLSMEPSPRAFLPRLQTECAKYGVAVVVERCPSGCAASGATLRLESGRGLLLLSARFLSDDHFWFSFFHEAAHLILHGAELRIEGEGLSGTSTQEAEANQFAQKIILEPHGESELKALPINKFAIARFARRCGVSPGMIVGQLQNKKRLSSGRFNAFKTRYKAADFIRGSAQA